MGNGILWSGPWCLMKGPNSASPRRKGKRMPKIFGFQVGKPTLVEMAIDEAIALITEGEFDNAIAVINDKALSRNPDDRRAILHLGIAHMMKKDYDRAISILVTLTERKGMDSEKAAAEIAIDKIKRDRKNDA